MAADLFRLVWTKPSGDVVAIDPTSREDAMAQFDNCAEIRRAAGRGRGRLRVLREADFQRSRST